MRGETLLNCLERGRFFKFYYFVVSDSKTFTGSASSASSLEKNLVQELYDSLSICIVNVHLK